jgi:tRNA/tmRNA/rRNA uracil-C5-methylase (TrmA/RlmC/RlmD family)
MNDSDRAWQRLGDQDPYFGVLSHEEFLASSLNEESLQKFFHSGEAHINHVCEYLQSRMGASLGTERVLDYGCGVGRLVIPLSMRFREVVGVDVSLGMLEQARRNCEKYAVQNARLMHTDELNSWRRGSIWCIPLSCFSIFLYAGESRFSGS